LKAIWTGHRIGKATTTPVRTLCKAHIFIPVVH
jgi:hypothetical protein